LSFDVISTLLFLEIDSSKAEGIADPGERGGLQIVGKRLSLRKFGAS
jgi:hypothetical protein